MRGGCFFEVCLSNHFSLRVLKFRMVNWASSYKVPNCVRICLNTALIFGFLHVVQWLTGQKPHYHTFTAGASINKLNYKTNRGRGYNGKGVPFDNQTQPASTHNQNIKSWFSMAWRHTLRKLISWDSWQLNGCLHVCVTTKNLRGAQVLRVSVLLRKTTLSALAFHVKEVSGRAVASCSPRSRTHIWQTLMAALMPAGAPSRS